MADNDDRISVRVGSGISRRRVMQQLGAIAAVGGLAGCLQRNEGDEDSGNGGDSGSDSDGTAPSYQRVDLTPPPTELDFSRDPPERDITMVCHNAAISFWDPAIGGLHDAASQLGWNATFTGPSGGFSVEEQVNILENVVASEPDAIVTTVSDTEAYNSVIQDALDNDIAVLTFNTNSLREEGRQHMREEFGQALPFVGQDQYSSGYANGMALLDKLPDDASKVTIGLADPAHSGQAARASGAEDAIRQNSDIEITDRVNYTDDSNEGVSRIANHLAANPELDGMAGSDAYSWFIGQAAEEEGMAEDMVIGGFDLDQNTLDYIQQGVMNYTTGQDPYSQGYLPVHQAFAYLERGMPPKEIMTGAEIVDQETIDFALERRNWGELLDYHGV
ncbi:substrate-binding domain-containing protein [Halopiger aswanensis]|uniref:Monosaccharide ABC transporter substrate-binding protein (CUT2 family) n=1 Tax=Halopiger aswanensis TaxID=148449 RepID=A0A3R7FW66_9EURY|nr:substrate-binding domain-containing protein [Halopiger aswanensis]RKD95530.1 monosaccharide ABC transporter substrate-binding protein (CUT2 family) [Halopiger aswanensis]